MKNLLTCFFLSTFLLAFGADKIELNAQSGIFNPDKRFDRKNRKQGQWEFYHDGNIARIASKGTFRHGKQIKTWQYYDTLGQLEKVETKLLLRPKFRTTYYHPNGKIEKQGYARTQKTRKYLNYFWVGKWKYYDENGNYVKTLRFKKGIEQESKKA